MPCDDDDIDFYSISNVTFLKELLANVVLLDCVSRIPRFSVILMCRLIVLYVSGRPLPTGAGVSTAALSDRTEQQSEFRLMESRSTEFRSVVNETGEQNKP